MQDAIHTIVLANPQYGIHKIKSMLKKKYPKITSKQVRAYIKEIKTNIERSVEPAEFTRTTTFRKEENPADEVAPQDHGSEFHGLVVELLASRFQKNAQAIIHVLGGQLGDYSPSKESIVQLAKKHPLYNQGNSINTPMHSCKLATTVLRLLSSPCEVDELEKAANCLARSVGAFNGMQFEPVTPKGLLSSEIEFVKQQAPSQLFLISVSLSDLHAHRNPRLSQSFAHSFSLVLFTVETGDLHGRIYQAFGPPDVGYSLNECVQDSWSVLTETQIMAFVNGYEDLHDYKAWNPDVERHYQRLFSCKLALPARYPILCHTRVHTNRVDMETASQIADFFHCKL